MKNPKAVMGWTLATAAPFVIATTYLILSRWPSRWWSPASDYLALSAAIVAGVAGLCLLVRDTRDRVIASIVYVGAAAFVLFWYSLSFVCSAFGDCL